MNTRRILLFLALMAAVAAAQTKSVMLITTNPATIDKKGTPRRLKAVLAEGGPSDIPKSQLIKFYPRPTPFQLRGSEGLLTWFSFTHPPKDRSEVFIEADQPSFGSILYKRILYVCAPRSPQSSLAVMNQLLDSLSPSPITKEEALSIALLFAKCTDTLQVFGDSQSTSKDALERMQNVASPPIVTSADEVVQVEFYSWSALPNGEISKWSFDFRGRQIVKVETVPVSHTDPR